MARGGAGTPCSRQRGVTACRWGLRCAAPSSRGTERVCAGCWPPGVLGAGLRVCWVLASRCAGCWPPGVVNYSQTAHCTYSFFTHLFSNFNSTTIIFLPGIMFFCLCTTSHRERTSLLGTLRRISLIYGRYADFSSYTYALQSKTIQYIPLFPFFSLIFVRCNTG